MLSILIPNFDEDVTQLVHDLHTQARELETDFEILICDQASTTEHFEANSKLSELGNVNYFKWNDRPGRAANRNHLADMAKGEWLFFIDSDAALIESDTLDRFWKAKHWESVICGTMYYLPEPPSERYILRWTYGREREMQSPIDRSRDPYQSFISFAFLIGKDSFNAVRFNEGITEYGHEDTLFGHDLKKGLIRPMHIDAKVLHLGLIPAADFLEKTRQSIRSLVLLEENGLAKDYFRVVNVYKKFKRWGLTGGLVSYFKLRRGTMERQLASSVPSLRTFDLYKLCYFACLMRDSSAPSKINRS